MNKKAKAPLIHITKRKELPWYSAWGIRFVGILLAFVLCAIVTMMLTGLNPIQVYGTMLYGAFGTQRKCWIMGQEVAILLCVALALTPAFRMRFWTLGGEGQILVGGLASAACMILIGDKIPNAALIAIMLVCSVAAGAVWAMIPALCKAKWNTNETLFTLMMNYVGMQLVAYFTIVWEVPKGSGKIGIINQNTSAGWLPQVGPSKYFLNILIVAVLTVAVYIYMNYSKQGYEISVVGESENTARYVGIKVGKVIVRTLIVSGALCGLADNFPDCGSKCFPAGRRHQPHHHDNHRQRARFYGSYGGLACEVQSHRHDLQLIAAGVLRAGGQRDLDSFRSQPVLRGYPDRHRAVLYHRQ